MLHGSISPFTPFFYMKPLSITRFSPNYEESVRLYKKEKHAKQKVRYHAMVLMHEINNCTEVAHIVKKIQPFDSNLG